MPIAAPMSFMTPPGQGVAIFVPDAASVEPSAASASVLWHVICGRHPGGRLLTGRVGGSAQLARDMMLKDFVATGALAVASLTMFSSPALAETQVNVSVDLGVFHDRLAPYGDWIHVNRYGECWRPRHVARNWRPYTVGYWTYTDYGWTWVSEENWGWATYHYGRWFYDPYYGW